MDHLKNAENFTKLLEGQFKIFGFKFGLDPIIGLIPGAGDVVAAALGIYIIWIGWQMQLPTVQLVRMAANLTLDLFIGAFPVIGDFADFFYKSNTKNLEILKQHRVIRPAQP
jgi:hypothetical protein